MIDNVLLAIDREAAVAAASALAAGLGALVWNRFLDGKVKLIRYLTHASSVTLNPPGVQAFSINSHTMVVANRGRKTATNVRLGHAAPPNNATPVPPYSMWPNLHHTVNGNEILIPALAPSEQFTITYIYGGPLVHTLNTYEKCDECLAERVNVQPTAPLTPLKAMLLWVLIFIGASTAIYFAVHLVWWMLTRGSS